MLIIEKILDYITKKSDLSEKKQEKIKNFQKNREKLIKIMIASKKINKFHLFLINNFLTLLGSGKIRTGPGTFTSFITVILWLLTTEYFVKMQLSPFYENLFWLAIITIFTYLATMLIPIYTRNLDDCDHQSIVMDEVVGQLITLCISYLWVRQYYQEESWLLTKIIIFSHIFLSFLLFRTLDISKPWFIGWIDRNIKTPFGVMLDDIAAGLVAAFINIAIFLLYKNLLLQLH